jgi:hypothetical protein
MSIFSPENANIASEHSKAIPLSHVQCEIQKKFQLKAVYTKKNYRASIYHESVVTYCIIVLTFVSLRHLLTIKKCFVVLFYNDTLH